MRLLVTGAGGMLGTELVGVARRAGHDVIAAAHADLDITDVAAVQRTVAAERPDAIVNCAAWTDVDGAERDPDGARALNADAPGHLARAARDAGASMLHISTDYVFDGAKGAPYVESDPTGPISVYGRTKLDGELAVSDAADRHWVVRTAWVFGASRRTFVSAALEAGGEVRGLTDQIGSPTWTGHLAPALLELLAGEAYGIHHVAGAGVCSRYELAEEAIRRAGGGAALVPTTLDQFDAPAPRPRSSALASERADGVRLPAWQEGVAGFVAERVVSA